MPPLNWAIFEGLAGAAQSNFEGLCRALIRRHYGRYGNFAARAAQPGVEFHLKLHTLCALGDPGRWYGWQCRWYDLPGGRALGATRRKKIQEAIAKTEKELPELNDWVLWTRRPLTKGDQSWYSRLPTRMQLHLWTGAEVEEHLSGDAEILRSTYFGELVLNASALANLHTRAVASIRQRWIPEVHQPIDAERAIRRALGGTEQWGDLLKHAEQLNADAAAIEIDLSGFEGALADVTGEMVRVTRAVAAQLVDAYTTLGRGEYDLLMQQLATRVITFGPDLKTLPRRLRSSRKPAALSVTNAFAGAQRALTLLDELDACLGKGLIAVIADAGCGKTELGAQISAEDSDRPAGVLLHGRDLQGGQSLDDLARHVVIQGNPAPSMEALVAALDAAGQRAHRRLPIVIDGLNEAEDPRDWKGQIASLEEILRRHPYVIVVCTVRSAFADQALPTTVSRLEIPEFGHDTIDAIRRYFAHYKINPADAELPLRLLSHPLTLRLFCEVTNPTREREVGMEAMPGSLTALFERYLDQAAERIAQLAPRSRRYCEQDVRTAFDKIGLALWEEKARSLGMESLRRRLGDEGCVWNESIVRALEQDGVLVRVPGNAPNAPGVAAVYDALAGHLVAEALVVRYGRPGLEGWLRDPVTVTAFAGSLHDQHPLAADTIRALVGLVPRRLRQQLWVLVDEPLRAEALRRAAYLEGSYLDADTVKELSSLIVQPPTKLPDLLDRLWDTRGAQMHPLNAEFLDTILRPMSVADRDLRWTEWIRRNRDELLKDLRLLEKRWQSNQGQRSSRDRLRARWVMWTLTSTIRELRDQATRTLYWFGRGEPAALFELTLDSLAINDPYVSERLLAASYGVVMAYQRPDPGFARALSEYLTGLRGSLIGPSAAHPTSHWLSRMHVQGTVMLAQVFHTRDVPAGLTAKGRIRFAPGPAVALISAKGSRASEVGRAIQMDFENYTLGRLFSNRSNYDMDHPGHRVAVAHVRGTIWALGWRKTGLGVVDKELDRYTARHDRSPTERYGKKYSWIGFYTYAGMLDDKRRSPRDRDRLSDVQVDPSFPEPPPPAPIELPIWARPKPTDDRRWIRQGIVEVPDILLFQPEINGHQGPWIAVYGQLAAEKQTPGRRVLGWLTSLLVSNAEVGRLETALNSGDYPGERRLPEAPSDYYTFAGEIPWNPEFSKGCTDGDPAQIYIEEMRVESGSAITIEILAHYFAWESYHSMLNKAGGALVPSRSFSAAFDLRGVPQSFSQTLPDGSLAALSLAAPHGFDGRLLYLREDLLHRYAGDRTLIWFICGERQLHPFPYPAPSWLTDVYRNRQQVWRLVRRAEDLSRAFASKPRRKSRKKP